MTSKDRTKGNVLLAEFLQLKKTRMKTENREIMYFSPVKEDYFHFYNIVELKFHKDWKWMMSLIKKINETIDKYECFQNMELERISNNIEKWLFKADIKRTWVACVDYVKWYNKNKL